MSIKFVVLDLDDTLYLERNYVHSGFSAVGEYLNEKYSLADFATYAWDEFLGGRRGNIFDVVLGNMLGKNDPRLVTQCIETYRSHNPAITCEPDAQEFMRTSISQFRTGLITDGPLQSQRNKIESLHLESFIEEIVVTSEKGVQWHKPHTTAFEYLQTRSGFKGFECVYIADNPEKDFIAPTQLGWKTVRLRRSLGLYSLKESPLNLDLEVEEFSDPKLHQLLNT